MKAEKDRIVRAIHLLLADVHLAIAGVRSLSESEELLIDDLVEWYEGNKPERPSKNTKCDMCGGTYDRHYSDCAYIK